MSTAEAFGTGSVSPVGMTDDEAIVAELIDRVDAFGGMYEYCRTFGVDKRNFSRYYKDRRLPDTHYLLEIIRNLDVPLSDFFASADKRTRD